MSGEDDLQAQILAAFGLKPWDITSAIRPPIRVRLWRAVTFARRRGKVIDWRSYEAAEAERLAGEAEYLSALPGRMAEIAEYLSGGLPDGLRFEWVAPTADEAVTASAEMGVDPAAPMTEEQRAEFTRRIARRRRERATDGE
jgi:hypothetical protein